MGSGRGGKEENHFPALAANRTSRQEEGQLCLYSNSSWCVVFLVVQCLRSLSPNQWSMGLHRCAVKCWKFLENMVSPIIVEPSCFHLSVLVEI
jgi:hypothetical protein